MGVSPQEADGSGCILQDISGGLSTGTSVPANGQGGSCGGQQICCRPQQVILGFDAVQCTELLQKSVPWGTRGWHQAGHLYLCAAWMETARGRGGAPLGVPRVRRVPTCCWPGSCSLGIRRRQSPPQGCSKNAKTCNGDTDGRSGPRAAISSYLHTQMYSSLRNTHPYMRLSASVCTCISHKCNAGAQPSEVSKLSIRHWIGNSKIKQNQSIIISKLWQQMTLMKAFGPVCPSVPIESSRVLWGEWTWELVLAPP